MPTPVALVARLNDLSNQIASYAISGIEDVAVTKSEEGGEGFVVTFVPESGTKPHQASVWTVTSTAEGRVPSR